MADAVGEEGADAPVSVDEGEESEAPSTSSEPPPDWNSDDEPPQDHPGDEQVCSRDGRVKKVIRRLGHGLERPGQYDIVRVRWRSLPPPPPPPAAADCAEAAQAPTKAGPEGSDGALGEVPMGDGRFPLAVEFALKCMRCGEVAEVEAPAAYGALASPLYGRALRTRAGRLPAQGKVPRSRRFLPAAPRGPVAAARAAGRAAEGRAAEGRAAEGEGEEAPEAPPPFRAEVELLSMTAVHMLTEDRSVTKRVLSAGQERRMPRAGDIVIFTVAAASDGATGAAASAGAAAAGARRHVVPLRAEEMPYEGLQHVLGSMKAGERCVARLPNKAGARPPGAGASGASEAAPRRWKYDPPRDAGLDVRAAAAINAARTATALEPGEFFEVAEEVGGPDGVLFLRLADGRGWVFDRLPQVGVLCVRRDASQALELEVTLHRWRRHDSVSVPEFLGMKLEAGESSASWPSLTKRELWPGPERLAHEVEEGSVVLAGLVRCEPKGRGSDGPRAAVEEGHNKPQLISWRMGEGAVPGYIEAAVSSMRFCESAEYEAPQEAMARARPGPAFEGRTPLRRLAPTELEASLKALLKALLDDWRELDEGDAASWPPPLPPCALPFDWPLHGEPVQWEELGLEDQTQDSDSPSARFRVGLIAATEALDVGQLTEEGQQMYLERERAHGNALVKLGRFREASAAYTKALDSVRRTPLYKALFPTERGRIEGAYTRDPGDNDQPLERLEADDIEKRRAGFAALHLNLALCAAKEGKLREARRHSSTVLGADPDNAKALFRRGSAAAAAGEFEEALRDLQRAAGLAPQDRAVREELQTLQRRIKEHRTVQKHFYQKVFNPPGRSDEGDPQQREGEPTADASGSVEPEEGLGPEREVAERDK